MRLIDLSVPLRDGMDVYPGDPPVRLRQAHSLPEHGWRLTEISLGSHAGTHVNAPWHMSEHGARLEDLPWSALAGRAVVRGRGPVEAGLGLIYADFPLDGEECALVLAARPPFVACALEHPLDLGVERALCAAGIVSFENLANTALLPRGAAFTFLGLPLPVGGDGAPVRAVALLDG